MSTRSGTSTRPTAGRRDARQTRAGGTVLQLGESPDPASERSNIRNGAAARLARERAPANYLARLPPDDLRRAITTPLASVDVVPASVERPRLAAADGEAIDEVTAISMPPAGQIMKAIGVPLHKPFTCISTIALSASNPGK